ncbi:MAG: hypothetical protein K8T89_16765 [Planctomycetes bacterium]|nr:hypothetical protein [Planctomycetota bacterium]
MDEAQKSRELLILGIGCGSVIAVGLALAGRMYYKHLRSSQRRADQFEALARERGCTFRATGIPILFWDPELGVALYRLGQDQRVRNVLEKTLGGMRVRIFDYRYSLGPPKYGIQSGIEQTVVEIMFPTLHLPEFSLRPSNFLNKIAQRIYSTNIRFPYHMEFSKQYAVSGTEVDRVQQLFHDDLIEFLVKHPGLSLDVSDKLLVLFEHDIVYFPDHVFEFVGAAFEVLKLLRRSGGH